MILRLRLERVAAGVTERSLSGATVASGSRSEIHRMLLLG